MAQGFPWTRREVWTRKLSIRATRCRLRSRRSSSPSALAWHDGVFAPCPILLAFLAGWLIQFGGVVTDNYSNLVRSAGRPRASRTGGSDQDRYALARRPEGDYPGKLTASPRLFGLALFALAGWPVIIIGLFSILASWAYSAGPCRSAGTDLPIRCFSCSSASYRSSAPTSCRCRYARSGALARGVVAYRCCGQPADRRTDYQYPDHRRYSRRGIRRVKGKSTIAVRFGRLSSRMRIHRSARVCVSRTVLALVGSRIQRLDLADVVDVAAGRNGHTRVWIHDRYDDLVPMTPRLAMLTVAYSICLAIGLAL